MSDTPRRRRRVALGVFGSLLVVLGVLGWAGWQALQGARALQAGAETLQAAQGGLTDTDATTAALQSAARDISAAHARFEDPTVRLLSAVPRVGDPLESARGLASAADLAVGKALLPLVDAAGTDPAGRLLGPDGAFDVEYLASLAAPSAQASRQLALARQAVARTPERSGLGRLDQARVELDDRLVQLQSVVDDAALATRLGPGMLGATRPQLYLLISQTPAEARGTGGLVGGYSLLRVDQGRISLLRSQTKRDLVSPGRPVVDLGAEFDEHYGLNEPTRGWINSNVSPHFPYAGQIWKGLFERQFPETIDGVLVLDPVALGYLLEASGPAPLPDGTSVSADTIADLTMREVYARFDDDAVRDTYLQVVNGAVTAALLGKPVSPRPLVASLTKAVSERRLLLYASDPAVREALADQRLSGAIPAGDRVLGNVIVDTGGSKLDYYLDRRMTYAEGCDGPSTLTLRLKNEAPANGLPEYVTPEEFRGDAVPGTNKLLATLHLPAGSSIEQVLLDGQAYAGLRSGTERNTVWTEFPLEIPPGQARELQVRFTETDAARRAPVTWLEQPLVRPQTLAVTTCTGMP